MAVIAIVKNAVRGRHLRVHIVAPGSAGPLCGGGHQAASVARVQGWQETIEEPNCGMCLKIQKQRREAVAARAIQEQQETINHGLR